MTDNTTSITSTTITSDELDSAPTRRGGRRRLAVAALVTSSGIVAATFLAVGAADGTTERLPSQAPAVHDGAVTNSYTFIDQYGRVLHGHHDACGRPIVPGVPSCE